MADQNTTDTTPTETELAAADAAAAQAAKEVAEAKAAVTPQVGSEDAPVEYDPTGNYVLDLALEFVGRVGVKSDHPAMEAAMKGDFSALRTHLGALGDKAKGYEKHLDAAEREYKAEQSRAVEKAEKTKGLVIGVMGSEENWEAVKTWAGNNADDSEREEINAALNKGGLAASAVARYLRDRYVESGGNFKAAAATSGATKSSSSSGDALSPAAYKEELAKLLKKVPAHRIDNNAEYKALNARRAAYRG